MFSAQYIFKPDALLTQRSDVFSLAPLTISRNQPGSFTTREFAAPRTFSACATNPYMFQVGAPRLARPSNDSPGFSPGATDPPHIPSSIRPVLASPRPAIPHTPATTLLNPYVFQASGQPRPRPSSDSLGVLTAAFEPLRISSTTQNPDNSCFASDIATAASTIAVPKPGKARRPKLGDVHQPSALRPAGPARMRSLAWQTPHGIAAMDSRRYLPPKDLAAVKASICRVLAPSSQSNYGAGPLRFT
ncbi:hypothetical protein B0H16DRAFT_1880435 [Mycena metata]|uniref:Uncharacterized protein n=1 Tax=Mycena metata TaxID=1033252 RepID=A0AAD7NT23_9AGAR|nr:hypothetical protein B0H16DRAFT_1880435 [Mycena metata]